MNWINGHEKEENIFLNVAMGEKTMKVVEQCLELGLVVVNILIINRV